MSIIINAGKMIKKQSNFWNNIHFHPTDAIEDDWGKRILDTIAEENIADTVRMYAMLEDIVTEKDGKLYYDFSLNDKRIDYMMEKGFGILLSYNFLPPFLAKNPDLKSASAKNKTRYKGKMIVNSIPADYDIWKEICRAYTEHIIKRYGAKTVSKWYLQCYNEPDIQPYFMGELDSSEESAEIRLKEYVKLYCGFADGINEACQTLGAGKMKIGGPALAVHMNFFEGFMKYVKENNVQLDFVCAHDYGTNPGALESGEIPLDVELNCKKYENYRKAIDKYLPASVEFVIDEWGASTGGFADCEHFPSLIFRETEIYAVFFAKMITRLIERNAIISKLMICLSGQHEMTEDFSGFRNFFSLNFIKKPIYNAFAVLRKLKENVLYYEKALENTTLLATSDNCGNFALVLTYSSENFNKSLPKISQEIIINGISGKTKRVIFWRIDEKNINPYRVYCEKGYGKNLTVEQIQELREISQLRPAEEFEAECIDGVCKFEVELYNNGLLLIEIL